MLRWLRLIGIFAALFLCLGSTNARAASWPSGVTAIDAKSGQAVSQKGKLDGGKAIALDWASKSAMSCFPATESSNFGGNHVFYGTQIPANSEMTITVTPDSKTDVSVYAYLVSTTDFSHIAPSVSSATSCEAGYDAKTDSNPGKEESVKLTATTNAYNVVIGVAGAKGVTTGSFTLKVDTKTAAAEPTGKITSATPVTLTSNKITEASGKLDGGTEIALSWASKSSVACFPATENANFQGKHVLYKVDMPAQSELTVTATPGDSKTDISLYAIQVGTTTTALPPSVSSAVSCEAGYDQAKDSNPGVAEKVKLTSTTNPYSVYVGVAGAKGVTSGSFKLKFDLKTAATEPSGKISSATNVTLTPNKVTETTGKLDGGTEIALGWASNSSVACFPATENVNFQGKHVLYKVDMPAQSELAISAIPSDPKLDISLYAIQVGTTTTALPPSVSSAVSCEAGYDQSKDSNPGVTEKVKLTSIKNPYSVYVGVAGPKGVTAGSFKLQFDLKTKDAGPSGTVSSATPVTIASGKVTEASGDLSSGTQISLGWAANSSVACFPATENANFEGNHVVYKVDMPAYAELTVTAVPSDPALDVSVYGYQVSTTSTALPPNVSSVVSCEAGYDKKNDSNPGVSESLKLTSVKNPYAVYVGVAGAKGVTSGKFTLKFDLKTK